MAAMGAIEHLSSGPADRLGGGAIGDPVPGASGALSVLASRLGLIGEPAGPARTRPGAVRISKAAQRGPPQGRYSDAL